MAKEFKDLERYIILIISPYLRAMKFGQEVWASMTLRSRKSSVFMVPLADVFDKVL
jgi:hypothetical protein